MRDCNNCQFHKQGDRVKGFCHDCLKSPELPYFQPKKPLNVGATFMQYVSASDALDMANSLIGDRGKERDKDNGERSMARTVAMFNAKYDMNMTEEQGWCFMVFLKHARMVGGRFKLDDYHDSVAYEALMTECAANAQIQKNSK